MAPLTQTVTNILSAATVALDGLAVFLLIILVTPLKKRGWGKKIEVFCGKNAILFAFLIAAGSVAGSLFYSQVAGFAPCLLCWIQRAFLYTEAVILFIAMVARKDEFRRKYGEFVRRTTLILSIIGAPISAYHTYLQFGGNALIPCSATGPGCEFVYFIEYGYVTIPTMALTAFALIILFMLCRRKDEGV
jgi:disulfide bond formation protein DsbB